MGNNIGGFPSNNGDGSFHLQLGTSATIDIPEKQVDDNKRLHEVKWEASYKVDGFTTCELHLTRTVPKSKEDPIFSKEWMARIEDDRRSGGVYDISITSEESGLTHSVSRISQKFPIRINNIFHPLSGVTETTVYLYGSESRGGLVVIERKRRRGDEKFYKVTVAHYYVASTGNVFNKSKIDIGLSMVAKIDLLNDSGDFELTSLEGPNRHPAAALLYMFEEVYRTGIWKPTSCPHCAKIQRQRSMFPPTSESEDSDNNNVISAPRPNSHGQSVAGVLGNNGVVRGNKNGNIIAKYLNLRR